jgi:alkylation response protein AidB-like acyl-CoA dehydrogenase
MRTRAEERNGQWVLNGQKMWITNGSVARSIVVAAKTDPAAGAHGVSNFIVPADAPGFSPGKDEPKMGMKGSPTTQLFFEDCCIPQENLLGRLQRGLQAVYDHAGWRAHQHCVMALGLGRAALEQSLKYAQERSLGQPIANFNPSMQAGRYGYGVGKPPGCSSTKRPCSKIAASALPKLPEWLNSLPRRRRIQACWQAIQIHGGMGYARCRWSATIATTA